VLNGIVRKLVVVLASLLVAALLVLAVFAFLPGRIEVARNRVDGRSSPASGAAQALHASLTIVDLHADSLLWGRELGERSARGHVDVPRLIEGHVALQVFALPTKTPHGRNDLRNDDRSDDIFWLALVQRWPMDTWRSLTARALYQAGRLRRTVAASGGRLVLIENRAGLERYLDRRRTQPNLAAALLALEGAHALDAQLDNLEPLFAAGYRMMAPTHFFDNEWGGSSAGLAQGGLTAAGRELIRRMEDKRMIVDLAHASSATIADVLEVAKRPVLVSHTGLKTTCDNPRNLSDAEARRIAAAGGLIGIGFWDTATCGSDAAAIARALRYATELVGVEHVALGSDFDGAVTTPFDAAGLAELTDALLAQGFADADIRRIMGANALAFLARNLP
jgi:microsomal dipeptidase-like Zn-dependent dipeptidase